MDTRESPSRASQQKLSSLNLESAGMPNDDLGASLWLAVFAQSLAEHPELWHFIDVTQERSERITALAAAFDKALAIAHSPLSNSKPNIRAKTLARNEAVKAVREVVNAIKAAPELTQSQIWNFGIDPRKIVDKRPRAKKSQKALPESGLTAH